METHLTRVDEVRHVAYSITHARYHLQRYPAKARDLEEAVEERSAFLQHTSGENRALLEALAIIGDRGASGTKVTAGLENVEALKTEMSQSRVRRMLQIDLPQDVAERLCKAHTPNFM